MAEVIAKEWGLTLPIEAVPLHKELDMEKLKHLTGAMSQDVLSLGYTTGSRDYKEQMGDNGEILQRLTRRLRDQLMSISGEYNPHIHLTLQGGLGKLFGEQPGKILGALFGLEQAAKPYRLRVEDPIIMANRESQVQKLLELSEFLRLRRMNVELVANAWVNSVDDARAFIDAKAVHLLRLNLPLLGSLSNCIELALACRRQQMGIIFGANHQSSESATRISTQVAMAMQPDLWMTGVGTGKDRELQIANNEISRTLTWLAHSS